MRSLILRRVGLVAVDVSMIAGATAVADFIVQDFQVSAEPGLAIAPYILATIIAAIAVLPLFGTDRTIWRLTALADYLKLGMATLFVVLVAMALGFLFDRLNGVARSLPVIQFTLTLFGLVSGRVMARLRHSWQSQPGQFTVVRPREASQTVLVIGLNRLAELFMQSVSEFAPQTVRIVGVLSEKEHHLGKSARGFAVLGAPGQAMDAIRTLDVHGVHVDRIVVALSGETLTPELRSDLDSIARQGSRRVDFLAEQLLLTPTSQIAAQTSSQGSEPVAAPAHAEDARSAATKGSAHDLAINLSDEELARFANRRYWTLKRLIDGAAAAVLLVLLAPVMVLVAIIVAIDVGLPVLFVQQRLGLAGNPFNVCKFRTLAAPFDGRGRRLPDSQRISPIGWFLRRSRLDEIPQLFQILTGSMSFIGPRPLLPVDQSPNFSARLLVRPGLTGWAQVMAGRQVSALDKMALDVWYVQNASLRLDLAIVWQTVTMILFGERIDQAAIAMAWRELDAAGLLTIRPPHPLEDYGVVPVGGLLDGRQAA